MCPLPVLLLDCWFGVEWCEFSIYFDYESLIRALVCRCLIPIGSVAFFVFLAICESDNSVVMTRGKRCQGKGGQIYDDGRGFGFGW